MNFAKRALLSVVRRPGKSALLMGIVFILGVVIAGAASIQQALENTKTMLADKIGITATVKFNSSLLQQALADRPNLKIEALSPELINDIGASSLVKSYDYTADIPLNYISDETKAGFTLCCRKNPDFTELQSAAISIVKGRGLQESDRQSKSRPIIISSDAAKQLNITTGSTVDLQREVYYGKELKETLKYTFTVVGLFDPAVKTDPGQKTSGQKSSETTTVNYSANFYILMDNASSVINGINEAEGRISGINAQMVNVVPNFVLKDRKDVETFGKIVAAVAPPYYLTTNNTEQFDYMISPTTSMQWIAQIVMLVAVAVAIAIISLVVTLSIRDRRREMGTYFSIGERKGNIALQILVEILAVSVMGLTVAMFVGSGVAAAVSGEMLKNQVVSAAQEEKEHVVSAESSIDSQVILENYHVTLDGMTIAYFFAAGLVIVALSAVAPVLYTLRLNPKKILLM